MYKRYLQAYGALYGNGEAPPPTKPRAKRNNEEDQEQAKLARWLTEKSILFFHVPNGGRRSLIEGAKFKRLGVQRGVPDLVLPLPRSFGGKHFCGLFIELKRKDGGRVSFEQSWWIERLRKEGYCAEICNGADEAMALVKKYLGFNA